MSRILILLAVLAIAFLTVGCGGGEEPAPAPEQPVAKAKAPPPKPAKVVPPAGDTIKQAVKEASTINTTKSKEVLDKKGISYSYDPVNKPDPFKPFKGDLLYDGTLSENPLLKYEVRYFRLVGVSYDETEPMALFEDPNGRAYILNVGDRIGRGGGVIQSISQDTVVVTETRISTRSDVGAETVQIPIKLHPVDELNRG